MKLDGVFNHISSLFDDPSEGDEAVLDGGHTLVRKENPSARVRHRSPIGGVGYVGIPPTWRVLAIFVL